jgi:hypothetical protein
LVNYVLTIYKFEPLSTPTPVEVTCREALVDSVVNFKRKHKGLNNLPKFTGKSILEIVEKAADITP